MFEIDVACQILAAICTILIHINLLAFLKRPN